MMKGKRLAILMLSTLMATSLGAAVHYAKADAQPKEGQVTITSAMQGDTIALLYEDVAEFALAYEKSSAINYAPTTGVASDRYVPKPATISWENTREDALYYTVRVGLQSNLSDAESFIVSETTADIDYLYSAKHYYYQVYAHYDGDEVVKSRIFDFYTADIPRTVYIEGVTNTRDIGGRYVQDGEYQVKQGMVYRGAEVDRELGAITEEGKRVMLYDLGIKTDLDIRGGDVQNPTGTSPIDASLNYVHLEAPWYTHIKESSYKQALTTEIRTFANPNNYPIYFHCSVGRDRAGTLSFLLGALLGVSEDDLYRDYEMSFFSRVGMKDAAQSQGTHFSAMQNITSTADYLKDSYPATTLNGSVERFVKEYLGITQAEVDSIRNTLLEKADCKVDNSAVKNDRVPAPTNLVKKGVQAVSEASDFACVYSANPNKELYGYGSSVVNTYTASEAAAKGVPAGYENEVLEVIPVGSAYLCGLILDFSAEKIPTNILTSVSFRVYIGYAEKNTGNYPAIRIPKPNESGWLYQVNQAQAMGEWITVTIDGSKFASAATDGKLDKFELSLRTEARVPFYIDSISYEVKANDGNAPVINYTGSDNIGVALGGALGLDVTATDAQEGNVAVQYIWEDGVALNENGTPTEVGIYQLTLKALDFYGNTATKVLTVNVMDDDSVFPVIDMAVSEVKAVVGAKPMLTINASDNSGVCNVSTVWSNGALDRSGKLTVGTHTWTITASDTIGNKTTKIITFVVTDSEPSFNKVTDEASEIGSFTVTFDGKDAIEVPYGFKISKPADPEKEEERGVKYTFLGWYVGDTEWDFANDVVTGDVDLQSKWQETRRQYTVAFDWKQATGKVEHGRLIPEDMIPEDPTKESTEGFDYIFDGWYKGDKKWDFATDVVTSNLTLTAMFIEVPRLYEVTFDGENATSVAYGSKIEKPADPTKEATDTHRYEFIGWYYGENEWNFETGRVMNAMNLQSKWNEIEIEVETPPVDGTVSSDTTDDTTTDQPSGIAAILAGCSGVVGGLTGTMLALGVATVVLLKKKED